MRQMRRVPGHPLAGAKLALLGGAVLALAWIGYFGSNSITPAKASHRLITANAVGTEPVGSEAVFVSGTVPTDATRGSIVVDHSSTDITAIPQAWIEQAKSELHIAYGHTSHGGQVTNGMSALVDFANNGGLGLELPQNILLYNTGGQDGALDLRQPFEGDAGYYPQWVNETTTYLGPPDPATGRGTAHPEVNVVMWAWCGQVSDSTEQQMLDEYLLPMSQLEEDYFGVTFVYMTGHADGTGEDGNLHLRNQQIRDYCVANDKVLYDFYDIELYDPDKAYFGDKDVDDNCDYDSNGDGTEDRNWAIDWQSAHIEGSDWYTCYCAHSQPLNCNQKAYAAWWLWARLAGWDGGVQPGPEKSASTQIAVTGETITYTITVQGTGAPLDATISLTDEVPAGLAYVPRSMSSTAGTTDESDAPVLRWTGVLSPTPVVMVTYSAVVTTIESQTITNTAVIASPGYEPMTATATITIEGPEQPGLDSSYKRADPQRGEFGELITYTVVILSSTGPFSGTAWLTDTVPEGLEYVPGTLTSTSGLVSDAAAPTLSWSGVLTPSPVVTVTYGATVQVTEPAAIRNDAMIVLSGYQSITRTATILVNPYAHYLPLVFKDA